MLFTILYRDIKTTVYYRWLWLVLSLTLALFGVLLLSMLDDYLSIQSQLQASDINRGVNDLIIIPYFRLVGYVASLMVLIASSRLFYQEKYSSYALFYQAIAYRFSTLFMAKLMWIIFICSLLLVIVILPPLGFRFFVSFPTTNLLFGGVALFYLLSLLSVFSVFLSAYFINGSVVCLLAFFIILAIEFLGKVIVEPIWLQAIVYYFSPFKHFNEILAGKVFISSIIFYLSSIILVFFLLNRSFENDRLTVQ